jgi:hypothetical protein
MPLKFCSECFILGVYAGKQPLTIKNEQVHNRQKLQRPQFLGNRY